ncbi:MAG: hypothetical protein BJBARM4_0950 [Candidatus Parvarchaeum acidiphilum ARMAN-4]|jgi:membrane protein insertase Oxa1/YidC/SpoIIIJ|uniref:Uncharacterized protein n=1 Tax=Candidatus Parvarchaeum acidiphilum ARMAN-4 TaxID=662760 RepID=D2EGQ1_PARA4|nr:MAG: hypothetical protein BJBARM4_0950 [Candidatus Parvarchaeum acidiphilum ARMAN-4]
MDNHKEKNEPKNLQNTKRLPLNFLLAIVSAVVAMASGILTIIGNLSILTFNSQSILNAAANSSNSTTLQYLDLALNGISSVKNGVIVLGPLLIIAGIFMFIAAFYLKSTNKENKSFGTFLVFLFSVFALLGLLIYIPFNSLSVLILVYLPLSTVGAITYGLIIIYIIIGLIAGAISLLKDKRYLS